MYFQKNLFVCETEPQKLLACLLKNLQLIGNFVLPKSMAKAMPVLQIPASLPHRASARCYLLLWGNQWTFTNDDTLTTATCMLWNSFPSLNFSFGSGKHIRAAAAARALPLLQHFGLHVQMKWTILILHTCESMIWLQDPCVQVACFSKFKKYSFW